MNRTFLARLHFDGTHFIGWQVQAEGRSVQGEVERVLARLGGGPVRAHAAGRTDAGVHALGLGVSFTLPERWSAGELHRALNALLPEDCWTASVQVMAPGFHARRSAEGRRYRYVIGVDPGARSPFRRRWEWDLCRPLDMEALQRAAEPLSGRHDFRAFAARGAERPHYECTIHEARWFPRPDGRGMMLEIAADRFLHHMVRFLVGTMVDVALERRPETDIAELLKRTDNADTSPPAPAHGLFFLDASYPVSCFAAEGVT
ncbi:MAG: tRNA pseudouridine(38-40) synthase TruA [Gemmatimonadales bacterium]